MSEGALGPEVVSVVKLPSRINEYVDKCVAATRIAFPCQATMLNIAMPKVTEAS